MDDLLKNILNIKNERKISDLKLQSDLGLYKTAIASWKNGSSQSYVKHLPKIAEYFKVSTDYLLGKTEDQPNKNSTELDAQLSGVDFALSGELHDLSEGEKRDILDYVRFKKGQREQKSR